MWKPRKSVEDNTVTAGEQTLELTAPASKMVQAIARNSKDTKVPVTQDQVNAVLNGIEGAIFELIEDGYRGVNISTLFKLNVVTVPEKTYRNPKTQEPVVKPEGLSVYYKLSTPFRKRIAALDKEVGAENQSTIIALYAKAKEKRIASVAKAKAKAEAKA